MKMSQAIHQLEIDQEVTAFSLSVTKNLFTKLGLSKTNASSNANSSSSFSPIESRLPSIFQTAPRNSSLKRFPSYSFGFSNENQCLSPVVIEDSTTRSNSSDPVQKNSLDQDKYNFSIRIVEPEESAFIENPTDMTVDYGYGEYSYASNALPTVVKVSRGEFSHRLHKEGWLEKKANRFLIGWQKRYFVIKPFKIFYAKNPEMLQRGEGVRGINLLVHPCEIIDVKENMFSIKIQGVEKSVKLKAGSLQEALEWIEFFKELFRYAKEQCYQNNKYHQQQKKRLSKADMITEEDFIKEANTGDLLFFKMNSTSNKFIRDNRSYDHIAIVVKVNKQVYIYDTVNERDFRLTCLEAYKQLPEYKNSNMIVCRKLKYTVPAIKEEIETRIIRAIMINNEIRNKLSLNKILEDVVLLPETPADILIRQSSLSSTLSLPLSPNRTRAQISPILSPEKEMKIHENDKYSAQLIATIYKKVGLLDALTPIVKYTPNSFAKKIKLLKETYLSGEYELALLN